MKLFNRAIEIYLASWKQHPSRKPLILRGARQTGKTTVVQKFAKTYKQFISVNLEKYEDKKIFDEERSLQSLLEELFFIRNMRRTEETLIFIDEIQQSQRAVMLLRYFYEEYPQYHIIAAGSLLEQSIDLHSAFPVGRVTYAYVHPVSFSEFLEAVGETMALQAYQTVPIPDYAYQKLLDLFHRYVLIGGMPEAVKTYTETQDLNLTSAVYHNLMSAYADDVEKYSRKAQQNNVIHHVFSTIFRMPCERITYNGYGNSPYGSRQIKEAFQHLEKAMLCRVLYPQTSTELPVMKNIHKKPRLHLLDTGLCCHLMGIQKELISIQDLSNTSRGSIAEHIVGQELIATSFTELDNLNFWVREKSQSSAEIDYIFPHENHLIPVEVKSGSTGTLKSLFQYMDMADCDIAVRLYGGKFSETELVTRNGKNFKLINIPYFHAAKICEYIS
ncbi:MAG: ATP-binding protein [Bacteroidetes bacterium]|nr:ATP-binding protein [Bacteroidota bacterium]